MTCPFQPAARFYKGREDEIDMIVIHFTAAGTLASTVNWFKNPKSKGSAHYVIDLDGTTIQMVREGDRAWHAGESEWQGRDECNDYSIGIELVNWGIVKLKDGKYRVWPDKWSRVYDVQRCGQPKKMGDFWWQPYPEAQIQACIKLVTELRARYKVPDSRVVGHEDVSPGRKKDPGPLFPMDRLRKESAPSLTLPDAHYQEEEDIPVREMIKHQSDRSGTKKKSWLERILAIFRR